MAGKIINDNDGSFTIDINRANDAPIMEITTDGFKNHNDFWNFYFGADNEVVSNRSRAKVAA